MFESSTPDGLAPISLLALIVFIATIGGLSVLWGIANLFVLLKIMPDPESSEKMERVFQINRKLLRSAIDIFKLDSIVGFIAAIMFFLTILGAVEHFDTCYYSVAYIVGAFNSVIIAFVCIVVSCLVKPKIINLGRYGAFDCYDAAKKAANFQTYFVVGEVMLILGIYLVTYQQQNEQQLKKPQQILKIAKTLVCFSFGSSTVSIASRIINSIYAKGSQLAMETLDVYEDKLKKDYKHPALLARALGQIVNKQLCTILDSVTYLAAGVSVAIYSASYNIVGTDQEGEIIFNYSLSNCYLPILSIIFSLFYNLFFNAIFGIVISPSSGDGVRTFLGVHRYATTILLCGFQALAAYLCLPAEFYIDQIGVESIKHPYHAYLCILFGLVVCAILSLIAQLYTTHPFFLNTVATSCKTGSATTVIYGMSFGFFFNFIPVIFIAGTLFLADYWLGSYGIGLAVIGYLALLPHYLQGSLLYTSLQNASFMSYISQLDQTIIQNLVEISKTKKDYEPHLSTFFTGLVTYFGFQAIEAFVHSATYTGSTSLKSPYIFFGMLIGAMLPYYFGSNLLRSIEKTAPAIPYDIRMQIQQIPGMATGNMDPDFVRNSSLFSFQCMISLKRFIPVLIGPIVLIGIAGGPALVTGFICGSVISGVQIGWSSGISGCAWSAVKKQIGLGNIRDEEGNSIKTGSDWQKAASVGNSIGQPLKDSISPSIPLILVYWSLQSFTFASIYSSIHP